MMKSILIPAAIGGVITWFLWKSHKTLAYIAAVITAVIVFKMWGR